MCVYIYTHTYKKSNTYTRVCVYTYALAQKRTSLYKGQLRFWQDAAETINKSKTSVISKKLSR